MKAILYAHYRDVPMSAWPWEDFTPEEIACKHCGEVMVDLESMDALQALRTRLSRPVTLNSAYRCPEHNQEVGGAPKSYHRLGRAFDIRLTDYSRSVLKAAAKSSGFTGFGEYNSFLHVDTGPAREWK